MNFDREWPKLGAKVFTTIRKARRREIICPHCGEAIYIDEYYHPGHRKIIKVAGKRWFKAEITDVRFITKRDITEEIAFGDTGETLDWLINYLEDRYGQEFNDFILITLIRIEGKSK